MRPDAIKLLCELLDCCFDPEALVALDGKVYERMSDDNVRENHREQVAWCNREGGTPPEAWQLRWRQILDTDDYDYVAEGLVNGIYSRLEAIWHRKEDS